jgi:hypothetical protein
MAFTPETKHRILDPDFGGRHLHLQLQYLIVMKALTSLEELSENYCTQPEKRVRMRCSLAGANGSSLVGGDLLSHEPGPSQDR